MKTPNGKQFYGTVTVSERGQMVIPAEARRDFAIEVGDKILVFGDLEKGLWLAKASMLVDKMPDLFANVQSTSEE